MSYIWCRAQKFNIKFHNWTEFEIFSKLTLKMKAEKEIEEDDVEKKLIINNYLWILSKTFWNRKLIGEKCYDEKGKRKREGM